MWKDRQDAGEKLGKYLRALRGEDLLIIPISENATEVADGITVALNSRLMSLKGLTNSEGKTLVLVDDGIESEKLMFEAIEKARTFKPKKIVVAVPVMPPSLIEKVRSNCDELFVLSFPSSFVCVGAYYEYYPERKTN